MTKSKTFLIFIIIKTNALIEECKQMKAVASESGTHSMLSKRYEGLLARIDTLREMIFQEVMQFKQEQANLTTIQAPSTVQQTAPQLAEISYSDIQAFSDKNFGYNDTTGHEIILRSLAMGKSDSNEFSHHNILLYLSKFMQTIAKILTSVCSLRRLSR